MTLLDRLHARIDASGRPTFVFERRAFLALEVVLLAACAVPAVSGWRSAGVALLLGALRLHEAELRREDGSVAGRHKERGGVSPLPPEKAARAAERAAALEVVGWLWPVLAALLGAAEVGRLTAAVAIGVAATFARAAWSRILMPRWRASRQEWRARSGGEG